MHYPVLYAPLMFAALLTTGCSQTPEPTPVLPPPPPAAQPAPDPQPEPASPVQPPARDPHNDKDPAQAFQDRTVIPTDTPMVAVAGTNAAGVPQTCGQVAHPVAAMAARFDQLRDQASTYLTATPDVKSELADQWFGGDHKYGAIMADMALGAAISPCDTHVKPDGTFTIYFENQKGTVSEVKGVMQADGTVTRLTGYTRTDHGRAVLEQNQDVVETWTT